MEPHGQPFQKRFKNSIIKGNRLLLDMAVCKRGNSSSYTSQEYGDFSLCDFPTYSEVRLIWNQQSTYKRFFQENNERRAFRVGLQPQDTTCGLVLSSSSRSSLTLGELSLLRVGEDALDPGLLTTGRDKNHSFQLLLVSAKSVIFNLRFPVSE